jgi:hypothetical protein
MDAKAVLEHLAATDRLAAVEPEWEKSACTVTDLRLCLDQEALASRWHLCGFEPPPPALLFDTARRILSDPFLSRFFIHTVWKAYEGTNRDWAKGWPGLEGALGKDACGVFYLLVALDFAPRLHRCHTSLGLPESVTRDTARQVSCFAGNYRMGMEGRLGIYLHQLAWLAHYLSEKYVRLGRLEFWAKTFQGDVCVYRNRATGGTLALAADRSRFTRDGFQKASPSEKDLKECWTAALRKTAASVEGSPLSPKGMALRQTIELPLSEWDCVLQRGTSVLDMHIPTGGGLTPDACRASFRRAKGFFEEHFPEVQSKAIVCESWLFNTQLQEILPEDTNLNVFQRQLYLYPAPSTGTDGLWFIFFQDDFDPATAPRDTRLQRAILDYLAKGNTWRGGRMFFLLEDLPHFGTEYYLRTASLR